MDVSFHFICGMRHISLLPCGFSSGAILRYENVIQDLWPKTVSCPACCLLFSVPKSRHRTDDMGFPMGKHYVKHGQLADV